MVLDKTFEMLAKILRAVHVVSHDLAVTSGPVEAYGHLHDLIATVDEWLTTWGALPEDPTQDVEELDRILFALRHEVDPDQPATPEEAQARMAEMADEIPPELRALLDMLNTGAVPAPADEGDTRFGVYL